jgi:2-polyprenyl-3-methyl-5-hydroxy-6-metoxy-1,4-benzoquinol methylase/uncharacterized protein YbaR (Trm112 family)
MDLYSLLACPSCKTPVARQTDLLTCTKCHQNYPIVNGVPVMLPDGSIPNIQHQAELPVYDHYDAWIHRLILQSLLDDQIVVDIGSGNVSLDDPCIIRMDVKLSPYVDLVADVHALPFLPESIDYMFSLAVFEHLRNPFLAAQEMYKALKDGGYIYHECNFMFPYHGYPYMFFNSSAQGMEQIFGDFTRLCAGVAPWFMPSFAVKALLQTYVTYSHAREYPHGERIIKIFEAILKLDLQQYDIYFSEAESFYLAAGTYFSGIKQKTPESSLTPWTLQRIWSMDKDLQARFPNINQLATVDNILIWARQEGRQQYPEIADYFEHLTPFNKRGGQASWDRSYVRSLEFVEPRFGAMGFNPDDPMSIQSQIAASQDHSSELNAVIESILELQTHLPSDRWHLLKRAWQVMRQEGMISLVKKTKRYLVSERRMNTHTGVNAPPTVAEIAFGGERVTHLYPNDVYYAHLSIYHFALQFCHNKIVLDAGSGSGYGSAYLAKHGARKVTALDIEEQAVKFSQYYFPEPNLTYQVMGIEQIKGFPSNYFDVILTSNALEHVPNVYPFFRSAWELLRADGQLIIAVPPVVDALSRQSNLDNPYHLNIWTPRQWFYILSLFFSEVQPYRHGFNKQGIELDFANTPEQTHVNESDFLFKPVQLDDFYRLHTLTVIFVAQKPKPEYDLPNPGSSLKFVDDSFTRPIQTDPSPTLLKPQSRVARALEIAQKQDLKVLTQKTIDHLVTKIQRKR